MRTSAAAVFLAAAMGVVAHPSGHPGHRHAHRSVEARDFVMATRPAPLMSDGGSGAPLSLEDSGDAAPAPAPAPAAPKPKPKPKPEVKPAPAPAPEPAPAPAPKPKPAPAPKPDPPAPKPDPSSGSGGSFVPFCGASKRATVAEIAYKGNTGSGKYGCNLMIVPDNSAKLYDYTATFTNNDSSDQECKCWLKIGPTGGINGFFTGNEALTFTLPGSGSKVLAIDENSQGGCACAVGSVPTTSFGEFASSWVEFDMANQSNGGWSGADASCLVSASQGLDIPALKVCGGGKCSTINNGGTGSNAYLGGMEALDGVGLNLPAGKVSLEITVG